MPAVASRIGRFFASPRLAIVLIGILLGLCVVSFLVPQRTHADLTSYDQWKAENPAAACIAGVTGMDDVFGTGVFFAVCGLLTANLVVCTLRRWPKRARLTSVPTSAPSTALGADLDCDTASALAAATRGRPRWLLRGAEDGERRYVLVDRQRVAVWGSLLMHGGILLVLLAGVVSGLTRFEGVIAITEGQTVTDTASSYVASPRLPLLGPTYSGASLRLDSTQTQYEASSVVQTKALLTVTSGGGSRQVQSQVNAPAVIGSKDFLVLRGGHAVRFSATQGASSAFDESVVRLGNAVQGGYADSVTLADGRVLDVVTTADGSNQARADAQPLRIVDPMVRFTVRGSEGSLALRPGESGSLGDLTISLGDVRLWDEFAVRQDLATPLVYAAFAVIIVGGCVRFGFGKTRTAVLLEPGERGTRAWAWGTDTSVADKALARIAERIGKEAGRA